MWGRVALMVPRSRREKLSTFHRAIYASILYITVQYVLSQACLNYVALPLSGLEIS